MGRRHGRDRRGHSAVRLSSWRVVFRVGFVAFVAGLAAEGGKAEVNDTNDTKKNPTRTDANRKINQSIPTRTDADHSC